MLESKTNGKTLESKADLGIEISKLAIELGLINTGEPKIYRAFAEQFLEKPILPKTGMLGEYASMPYPTFCTWKGIPTIDDADQLD